jgi:hypothetical protein
MAAKIFRACSTVFRLSAVMLPRRAGVETARAMR